MPRVVRSVSCLGENTVVELLSGALSEPRLDRVERHIDECSGCRLLVAASAKSSIGSSSLRSSWDGPTEPDVSRVHSADSIEAGHVIAGRFRVHRRIGRGSMGSVYDTLDLKLGERVALKLLRPELVHSPRLMNHLQQEVVLGRRISHPNVCRLYDIGVFKDQHFISMALVRGGSLNELMDKGPLSPSAGLNILVQICGALEAAHKQGVVHRDLKPSNIMIDRAHHVTVMDFGLARDLRGSEPSESGLLIGTPAYWAPEQARGERASQQSDLYALGVIACELFGAERPAIGKRPRLDEVPSALRPIIARCLCFAPTDRYATATELKSALLAAAIAPKTHRLRPIAMAGLAALGIALGAAFTLAQGRPEPEPAWLVETDAIPKPVPDPVVIVPEIDIAIETPAPEPEPDQLATAKPATSRSRSRTRTTDRGPRTPKEPPAPAIIEAEPEPQPEPEPEPVPTAALAALRTQVRQSESSRAALGILDEDLGGYQRLRAHFESALDGADLEEAQSLAAQLEAKNTSARVDGTLISKKLSRINGLTRGLAMDQKTADQMQRAFALVHDRYFAGDYQGANSHLNEIWRLVGRSR